jgi:hypothetical protein
MATILVIEADKNDRKAFSAMLRKHLGFEDSEVLMASDCSEASGHLVNKPDEVIFGNVGSNQDLITFAADIRERHWIPGKSDNRPVFFNATSGPDKVDIDGAVAIYPKRNGSDNSGLLDNPESGASRIREVLFNQKIIEPDYHSQTRQGDGWFKRAWRRIWDSSACRA